MGLARILGVCAALLFASSVSAAVTIDLGPSDYRKFGPNGAHTASGIRSSFGQTVRMPPLSTNLAVSRNPVVPYGSVANGLRNFTRINPASAAASAAITALFLGLDWVFDEGSDSWMKEGVDVVGGDTYTTINVATAGYPNRSDISGVTFPSPAAACADLQSWLSSQGPNYPSSLTLELRGDNRFRCVVPGGSTWGEGRTYVNSCQPPAYYDSDVRACVESGYIDLDPSDWTRLEDELPSMPAQVVSSAAGDAQLRAGAPLPGYHDTAITGPSSITGPTQTRTSTDPSTGTTTTTETTTQTDITYGDETITTTDTTTTNTYVDGQHTGTETTTETPGELPVTQPGGPGLEWPGFCDWAVKVCDWLDWTQEDPGFEDPDLPVPIDEDFYTPKNINFGSKSCPADYGITVPFINTTVSVPMQPFCDFAGIIYYMVMASAYIYAAYISVGVARNG